MGTKTLQRYTNCWCLLLVLAGLALTASPAAASIERHLSSLVSNAQEVDQPDRSGVAVDLRVENFSALENGPLEVGCLELFAGMTLFGSHGFGGLSAMVMDGDHVLLLSDAGLLFGARAGVAPDGRITAMRSVWGQQLRDPAGSPLGKRRADTEGVVRLDEQRLLVSVEGQDSLIIFRRDEASGQWREDGRVPLPSGLRLPRNAGFEAITTLPNKRLLLISEHVDEDGLAIVLVSTFTLDDVRQGKTVTTDDWQSRRYQPAEQFRVTDATVDQRTDTLYILERAFSRMRGPRARIVQLKPAALLNGDQPAQGKSLAQLNLLHGIDNMEGIAIAYPPEGSSGPIIHLISDDNYSDMQRSVLISARSIQGFDGCND